MIDLTQIIVALIGVLGTIVTYFLIPYLKTKIDSERWEQLQKITFVAVSAAEQLGLSKVIEDKYQYAKVQIEQELQKLNIKINEAQIKAAIEAAVRQNFPNK